MRTCTQCKVSKPDADFYRRPSVPCGRQSHCKSCNAGKARRWRKNNPERRREQDRRCDASRWAAYLKRTYGITTEQYDSLLRSQDGKCAICKTDQPGGKGNKRFHVDHIHGTTTIRGLLCSRCNQMVGYSLDQPEILEAGASYLRINAEVAKAFIEAYLECQI